MERLNNINIQKARSTETRIKSDPSTAKKTQIIEGEWVRDESNYTR